MARDHAPRLRAPPLQKPLHVVLVEPEIPPNTGNIARLCAATGSVLHLVGPLGFRTDEKALRRAGIDYWHLVDVHRHLDLAHFRHAVPEARWILLSASARQNYLDAAFQPGDALLFGRESVGLPDDFLAEHAGAVYGIPTLGPVRSLNLANAASIVLYEALRQIGATAKTFMGSSEP
jgi:tRNA (cytidine/uridine-2'-O-)-methyltransferase